MQTLNTTLTFPKDVINKISVQHDKDRQKCVIYYIVNAWHKNMLHYKHHSSFGLSKYTKTTEEKLPQH